MKRIGVREFKNKATALISEGETLVIEKYGHPVGFYIPLVEKDKTKAREAAERLERTVEGILQRTGMTREEFEREWDEAGWSEA